MSELRKNATVVGDRGPSGEAGIDGLVGDGSIETYVDGDETLQYLVVGTDDGVVRETDDWQTTEVPGVDRGAVVIVTDRRVRFVVGDCRDPDVDGDEVRVVDHADVEDCSVTNSLLSTAFTVTSTDGISLSITPRETDGLEGIADFVIKAARQWRSAREFFSDFEKHLIAVEEEIADGHSGRSRRSTLIEELGDLGENSSLHAIDLPALDADCAAARTRIDYATCRGYWHRARELIQNGDDHRDDDALPAAATAYRDASDALLSMIHEGELAEAAFSEGSLTMELGPFEIEPALRDRLADCADRATESEADVAEVWTPIVTGYDHLESAVRVAGDRLDADSESLATAAEDARDRAADAFANDVETVEARGDEAAAEGDSEQARAAFEEALALLDQRSSVTDRTETAWRERLEEKVERTKWEWVGDQ